MRPLRSQAVLVVLLLTAGLTGFVAGDHRQDSGQRLFQDVMTLVSRQFVDSLDASSLYEKASRGLIDELKDPYAELYSPDELDEFTAVHEAHYGGLGMLVEPRDGVPTIARVYPNTPAEGAGMHVGDRVRKVDGIDVDGWPLEKVTGRMKGDPGTTVSLGFDRPGATSMFTVKITRAVIQIPTVPYAMMLEDKVGYIPLLQFGETAAEEVTASVKRLEAQGAKGLILDLRGNGGGLLDQAVEIAGLFLPAGSAVVEQRERRGEQAYVSHSTPIAASLPLTVLVDGGSASASEILAGALQDHDRAVIIGETSFGKGLVQTAFRLQDGYILKITTGQWYTPVGRSIHRKRELVNGRLVETDTAADTTLASRPTYHSDAGRLLYGGGGITPDLRVSRDSLTKDERAFVDAVLPQSTDWYAVYADYAFQLKDQVKPGFTVTQQMRDELYRRLQARGVAVPRPVYDAAGSYIDLLLGERVARLAFGDAGAKQWAIEQDKQLERALQLLRGKTTQRDLFAAVGEPAGRS